MANNLSQYHFDNHKYSIDTADFNAAWRSEKPVCDSSVTSRESDVNEQDSQCTYNVTLGRVRAIIVVVG